MYLTVPESNISIHIPSKGWENAFNFFNLVGYAWIPGRDPSSHSSFQEAHPTAPSHPVPVVLSGAAPGWVWWGFHTDVPMFAATSLGDHTTGCEYVQKSNRFFTWEMFL